MWWFIVFFFQLSIQKFPFPEYKEDMFNVIFKTLMPLITMLSFITISISVLKKVVEEKSSGVNVSLLFSYMNII